MSASDAEQLTEDEAKAVLLVLGPQLEWMPAKPFTFPGTVWDMAELETQGTHCTYEVEFSPNHNPLALVTFDSWDEGTGSKPEATYWYNSPAEAKAACEVHAATGQFPPGVEVVEST